MATAVTEHTTEATLAELRVRYPRSVRDPERTIRPATTKALRDRAKEPEVASLPPHLFAQWVAETLAEPQRVRFDPDFLLPWEVDTGIYDPEEGEYICAVYAHLATLLQDLLHATSTHTVEVHA